MSLDLVGPGTYERLLDATGDLLVTVDAGGRCAHVNASWQRTLGWEPHELIAVPFINFVHPDDVAATLELMGKRTEPGYELFDFENRYRCRDGTYRFLSWRASTDGTQWFAAGRDITDSKLREVEQAELMDRIRGVVVERTRDLRAAAGALEIANTEVIRRLSMAVEYRDEDTGQHVDRVSRLSGALTQRAGLDPELWEPMRFASPLHDAGKVAIPDAVLLKPGKLSPEERAVIETHAQLGYELLRGSDSPVLELAAKIAWTHHERFDGTGYPRGLCGTDIPVEGRIVAIVDVFDALTSDRVYRSAFSVEKAVEMMSEGRGTHFDSDLLDVFFDSVREMSGAG